MKAVVLAAGEGVRLRPLTFTRPKHLIPVGGEPVLEHVLNSIKNAGIHEALIVVHFMKDKIQRFFGDGSKYGMKLEYVTQHEMKGTADAVGFAKPYVKEDFLLLYGDVFTTSDVVKHVIQVHKKESPAATMAVVPVEHPEHYGMVKLDDSHVTEILEKPPMEPASTNLANTGVYVFSVEIFEKIEQTLPSSRGELEITDSLSLFLKEKRLISGVRISKDEWLDIGRMWDLLEANCRVLKSVEPAVNGQIEYGAHLVGPVVVAERARVRSGAYIQGPVFIDEGSDVGPNCFIRPYTSMGKNVRIGNACEIKNSIIMDGTHIGHLSYVGDSVVGENCNLGAGTVVANLRLDEKTVKMQVKNEILDSGRKKFGAVLGDQVKTGINALFMPGVKVGCNSWIGANVVVYRDVPSNRFLILKQKIEERELTK
ncbi:MAG: bifunctional sugar-1-phosphate nucleotidylyltransferase/acetyltransferase [Thermoproteota archaeon]|nr:bifunctional sugar-1-phosphate nucleotidylyltransferase/acetyltransferase [Thermoproteota archaeon]